MGIAACDVLKWIPAGGKALGHYPRYIVRHIGASDPGLEKGVPHQDVEIEISREAEGGGESRILRKTSLRSSISRSAPGSFQSFNKQPRFWPPARTSLRKLKSAQVNRSRRAVIHSSNIPTWIANAGPESYGILSLSVVYLRIFRNLTRCGRVLNRII